MCVNEWSSLHVMWWQELVEQTMFSPSAFLLTCIKSFSHSEVELDDETMSLTSSMRKVSVQIVTLQAAESCCGRGLWRCRTELLTKASTLRMSLTDWLLVLTAGDFHEHTEVLESALQYRRSLNTSNTQSSGVQLTCWSETDSTWTERLTFARGLLSVFTWYCRGKKSSK